MRTYKGRRVRPYVNKGRKLRVVKRRRTYIPRNGLQRTVGFYGRYNNGPGYRGKGGDELKFFDQLFTAIIPAPTGTIINGGSIVNIPQNDTQSGRDGRNCTISSIQFRSAWILASNTSASPWDQLRFIVYLDQQTNGATATVAQILETTSLISPYNMENSKRFRILMDKTYDMTPHAGVTTAYSEPSKFIKWFKKCNIELTFDATAATGAITTIRSNNIGMLFLSQNTLIQGDVYSRVRFFG